MKIIIRQKYFTIGNKFALTDENERPILYAEEQIFKLLANLDIFSLSDALLYHMQAKMMHFFSYFEISNGLGQVVGYIDERAHMPGFRRAKMEVDGMTFKIKGGPIHMKTVVKDENGKWDKKHPIVTSKKRLMRVADTYVVDVDESRIEPAIGAMIALWYDKVRHKKH